MKRTLGVVLVALALSSGSARADYLYDAFRAECTRQAAHHYSAADPVIATVPIDASEVGRIGNNFLVYGGFQFGTSAAGDILENELRGHLYGIRLFREATPGSNDWEFTDTGRADLLATCGETNSACLFDAGQLLQDRTAPRRIFTGMPGTPVRATSQGDFTVPLTGTRELSATSIADLRSVWTAWVTLGAASARPASPARDTWAAWVAAAPIAAAMPQPKWVWGCVSGCEKHGTPVNGWRWDGWDCPTNVPSSLCNPSASVAAYPALWSPTDAQLLTMSQWLHGQHRNWKLGDIYHSSAAVVEPPAYEYKDRFYPEFRERLQDRPTMIYVGANDGMIHAFHASPDLEKPSGQARWQPGEEAWAYLPTSMLARTLVATEGGQQRFFSQDLSCRFTDVQVNRGYRTSCDTSADPNCGWRTVLVCGQGWGGSWLVALDVTDPAAPAPLWEFTHFEVDGNKSGLGRTWSLPAIGLVALEDPATGRKEPTWVTIFGNGYNSAMRNESGGTRLAYRNLNLPFEGTLYPEHGLGSEADQGHAYVLDTATGKLLAGFHKAVTGNPFVADGTVLDFTDDGLVDAGYLAAYRGMNRVGLASRASAMSMCELTYDDDPTHGPITGHPTAFAYQTEAGATTHPVVLVVGAGIDSGHTPDEQANNGNRWGIGANLYSEVNAATCPSVVAYGCDLAFGFNDGDHKARLLGAPMFSRQVGGEDWLLYTIWTAPAQNKLCDGGDKAVGDAHLFCMDVTLVASDPSHPEAKEPCCRACKGFGDDTAACGTVTLRNTDQTLLYQDVIQPPSAPIAADGRIYVTSPDSGLSVTSITDRQGHDPEPNTSRPQTSIPPRLISWREVYAP